MGAGHETVSTRLVVSSTTLCLAIDDAKVIDFCSLTITLRVSFS